jgi:hypothetical protein
MRRATPRLLRYVLLGALLGQLLTGVLLVIFVPLPVAAELLVLLVMASLVWLAARAWLRSANRAVDDARREWEEHQR